MKLRCAIFDFDGTLFDSMYLWDAAPVQYIRSLGREPKPTLCEELRPMSFLQAAKHMKKEYALPLSDDEIMAGVEKTVEHYYRDEVQPKNGVIPFLRKLRAGNVSLCIATATNRPLILAALRRCGMEELFDAIFTCTEVGHGKDEPDIFRIAMENFGANRDNTVIFEDAFHAVEAAKKDGFTVALVRDASEKRQAELRAMADFYITDFNHTEAFRAAVE